MVMTVPDEVWRGVIDAVTQKARRHFWVSTITVASAAIVLVGGLILAFLWIRYPLRHIERFDTGALAVISGVRVFALAIVAYLVSLLTTMYRYNAQLWNHYTTRAWALELAKGSEITLQSVVAALSPSSVNFTKYERLLADIATLVESNKPPKD
jgi:hypothetical protein